MNCFKNKQQLLHGHDVITRKKSNTIYNNAKNQGNLLKTNKKKSNRSFNLSVNNDKTEVCLMSANNYDNLLLITKGRYDCSYNDSLLNISREIHVGSTLTNHLSDLDNPIIDYKTVDSNDLVFIDQHNVLDDHNNTKKIRWETPNSEEKTYLNKFCYPHRFKID